MGIKIKQIDGLQDALNNIGGGGGTDYYLTTFETTGVQSDNGPVQFETEIVMSAFGLSDPVFLTASTISSGAGFITVNGVLVKETYYNSMDQKVTFITDYPVDETDVIQFTVLWDGNSGE